LRAVIPYLGGELEAVLEGERWTVRLGELEKSSAYLDFALSELLGDRSPRVHSLAARLIEKLLVEAQAPHVETSDAAVPVARESYSSRRRSRLKAQRS
jgi:hypothetical protein